MPLSLSIALSAFVLGDDFVYIFFHVGPAELAVWRIIGPSLSRTSINWWIIQDVQYTIAKGLCSYCLESTIKVRLAYKDPEVSLPCSKSG